jgi:hypothetical protein
VHASWRGMSGIVTAAVVVVSSIGLLRATEHAYVLGPWLMESDAPPMPWRSGAGAAGLDERAFLEELLARDRVARAAAAEMSRSSRPELREFAEQIKMSRTPRIMRVRHDLLRWYDDQRTPSSGAPPFTGLTMRAGDALDRAFLIQMVKHDRLTVLLAQQLLTTGQPRPAVRELAVRAREGSKEEAYRLAGWLYDWFGTHT